MAAEVTALCCQKYRSRSHQPPVVRSYCCHTHEKVVRAIIPNYSVRT